MCMSVYLPPLRRLKRNKAMWFSRKYHVYTNAYGKTTSTMIAHDNSTNAYIAFTILQKQEEKNEWKKRKDRHVIN